MSYVIGFVALCYVIVVLRMLARGLDKLSHMDRRRDEE